MLIKQNIDWLLFPFLILEVKEDRDTLREL